MTAAPATNSSDVRDYIRPVLYAKQAAFLFAPERYSITEASTKSGKTAGCLVWLMEQAALGGGDGRNYWWVAPTFSVAKIAFRRMKRALPREHYTSGENELTITLANGAVMWFKGGENTDALYGEDVYAVVIDESSRVKEEAWHAVRSTITATRGPIRIIGNVRGRKNWAYQLARKAESGTPDMAYFKLTAYDAVEAGILDAEEVEDAKRTLPANIFGELFLAEPTDDGGNPFGIDAINACIAPLSTGPPVAWGIDLARSHDWTVAIGLDKDGHACRFERWQGSWESTVSRIRLLVGTVPAVVDSTGVGAPVTEALQKGGRSNFKEFVFTRPSKMAIMEGLALAIQSRAVTYPDGPIVRELSDFEFVYSRTGVSYAAPEGLHDDTVCALALAVECKGQARLAPRSRILDEGRGYTAERVSGWSPSPEWFRGVR